MATIQTVIYDNNYKAIIKIFRVIYNHYENKNKTVLMSDFDRIH